MNFDFDDQQIELHATVARALADMLPFEGHDMRGSDDSLGWNIMAELGLFGLLVPEAYGGLGLSLVELALIAEDLGARLAPQSIADTLVASDVIARHGSDGQKAMWLPRLAAGELRVALAWHEAAAGYAPERMGTSLAKGALTGEKILVAHVSKADFLLVPFRHGNAGTIGLAMIEPGRDGVSARRSESLDPACDHHDIRFSSVELPAASILAGRDAADRLFDLAAALQGAMALGIAAEVVQRSVNYARERIQFDRPIGSFQAIKHKCADMYTQVEAARAASYYAISALAGDADDAVRAASMSKAFCADAAVKCCHDGIQVHGGMGFTWELGLHHFLRRVRVISAIFGDSDFHRERVIALTLEALAPPAAAPARSAA